MKFEMQPGTPIRRVDLHQQFGGRRQGGISPSAVSENVFLFTDPVAGAVHGYLYDGWREDRFLHYTGEGQFGDQRMAQGNRAIRDHLEEGRDLHVFETARGVATYMGEFQYVDHYLADAPESGSDRMRSVIVFRLSPLNIEPREGGSKVDLLGTDPVKEVPVELHLTERMFVNPNAEAHEAERREQKLVVSFMTHLVGSGHAVCRLQLRPDGEPAPIFCDLFDKSTHTIYEAKGSVSRPAFRMAIGQLADYARLIEPRPQRVILAPQKPREDLLRLAASEDITVVWEDAPGRFVSEG